MQDANPPLTLRSAYQAPPFLIDDVELDFDLQESATIVRSRLQIRHNPKSVAQTSLRLDGQNITLLALRVDGKDRDLTSLTVAEESLTIPDVPKTFTLEIETRCNPAANKSLEGLYLSGGNFCTQCEAEGFRKITYFLDRPDVMASFKTRIEADQKQYPVLLSNGNPTANGTLPDGRHFAEWVDPHKKPCYLFALVAGSLVRRTDTFTTRSGREVGLHIYVEDGNLEKTAHCMASLKRAMTWDEEAFGREYDLDLFQIVAVSDFNMGAMENKGLNIFNTKFVLADPQSATDADHLGVEAVVGHEYFHNWSGNRVTCRDWFQLSLKEGFTVFRDQQFSSAMGSEAVKRIEDVQRLRSAQFPEDAGPTAHPVRPDSYLEISNFYTVTIYEKGAEVVRMLHTLLGEDLFRQGTDLYFDRHDGHAATCEDFVCALEEASGRDLQQFRLWYSQAGTPRLHADYEFDDDKGEFTVRLRQEIPDTPGQTAKAPMHLPIAIGLLGDDGADLPLHLKGSNASANTPKITTALLELRVAEDTFTFTGLTKRPVPSLLRGFSAPVKLSEKITDRERVFRMAHDSDPVARWDAGQALALKILLEILPLVGADEDPPLPEAFLDAFGTALGNEDTDPALLALALALPSYTLIAEDLDRVDPDAIFLAREWLRTVIAATHGDVLLKRYRALTQPGPYATDPTSVGKRMLRNLCLNYLTTLDDRDADGLTHGGLASEQFEKASNMTDRLAALGHLTHTLGPARESALDAFFERHHHEPLVLDKWFAIQALSRRDDIFETLESLMRHADFEITNPNKVRALIATFAAHNPVRFHDPTGRGYTFLADRILELDDFNPQIAARLLTPLARFRRFETDRATLMQASLTRILNHAGLSQDVREIASKALRS